MNNPLFNAVQDQNISQIRSIIKEKPFLLMQQDGGGNTPVHLSVKGSHDAIKNNDIESAKNLQKITHYMITKGQQAGFNPSSIMNNDGFKVLDSWGNQVKSEEQSGGALTKADLWEGRAITNEEADEVMKLQQQGGRKKKYKKMTDVERKKMFAELGLELDEDSETLMESDSDVTNAARRRRRKPSARKKKKSSSRKKKKSSSRKKKKSSSRKKKKSSSRKK